MPALSEDYQALRHEVGAVWLERDFLRVHGPDAISWLQGQLSQDVAALSHGQSADSFLLQPQGKVDAFLRVTYHGHQDIVLDVDGGYGEAVAARLGRFKIRVKAEMEPLPWRCLAIRGPGAKEVDVKIGDPAATMVAPADWPGLPGVDLMGLDIAVPDGVRECGPEAWEVVRIEAGMPMMGKELTEKTIPAEAGVVDRAVSFTKGCFTGQELVARIDSRGGNVPRHLRGVVLDSGGQLPPPGAAVVLDAGAVGSLTSVAASPAGAGGVALAYVRREVTPPVEAEVTWDGGSCPARVETLPLVP